MARSALIAGVIALLAAGSACAAERQATPASRLLGAVIEGAGGPWFLKLTGREATVTAAGSGQSCDPASKLRSVEI